MQEYLVISTSVDLMRVASGYIVFISFDGNYSSFVFTYGEFCVVTMQLGQVERQIEELPVRIATSVDFVNAVRNNDRQVAQITFNDDIINIVTRMLEEKTEFVQTYFANQDFQNFVNARVFQAAVSQLSNIHL